MGRTVEAALLLGALLMLIGALSGCAVPGRFPDQPGKNLWEELLKTDPARTPYE